MNDFKKYLRIVRLIREGRSEQLSKKDYEFFRDFTLDPEAISNLKLSKDYQTLSEDEKLLFESNLAAFQTPEFREDVLLNAQDIEKEELAEKITSGLNIALAGSDILTSASQIGAANRAQADLKKPQKPVPLTEEPALDRAMAEASRGNLDAARALAPAQLAILDQYLNDRETAKSVSGGQAGVYGSLAQVASTRRGRRSLELAPIYDEIASRGRERYDRLLANKLQQNRDIQDSQAQFYPYDVSLYMNDARNAGQLGSRGRSNMRSSVGALSSFLPSVVSELGTRKRFRDIYNANLMYDEDNAKVMAEADHDLRKLYDQPDDDYYLQQEQLYGLYS